MGATIGHHIVANCSAPKFFNSTSIVAGESIYDRPARWESSKRQRQLNTNCRDEVWWRTVTMKAIYIVRTVIVSEAQRLITQTLVINSIKRFVSSA